MDMTTKLRSLWKPLLTIMLLSSHRVLGHKILLFPYTHGFSSHLLDMLKLGRILKDDGHQLTFLVAENTKSRSEHEGFPTITYPAPSGISAEYEINEIRHLVFKPDPGSQINLLKMHAAKFFHFCDSLLGDTELLQKLISMHFDLLLYDISDFCSYFLVEILHIPYTVYYPVGFAPIDRAHFPSLPSFIPGVFSDHFEDMAFLERVQNFVGLMAMWMINKFLYIPYFDQLQQKHNIIYDLEVTSKALHFVHADFSVDSARPIAPNIIPIGGIFTNPASPLPKDLEAFIQSSGEDGVIVVCFGTLVTEMDERKDIFAKAFARLPYKVLWRLSTTADPPKHLGNNTLLLDWLPQNDLLGHPKTKAFITHCGMSSAFEAIDHAKPVVAFPLFGDQFQNTHKLITKAKMGRRLDFHCFNEEELYSAIIDVTTNPQYALNAKRVSHILKSQPVSQKEKFLFYVNQVAKNKGVDHLLIPAFWKFSFIQLYCIDIVLFLITISFLICASCMFVSKKCVFLCLRSKPKPKKE